MNVITVIMDTLRRDHLSSYGTSRASSFLERPIQTPNLDRFSKQGTVFEQAYLGSFPCMPARRDIWTGRYEFPWRGWGPLEDDDLDLFDMLRSKGYITMLVSDHYHILERDAGNYHFGFNGWEMIRGQEHDPYITEPLENGTKENLNHGRSGAWYLHQKNHRGQKRVEEDLYAPQVFRKAAAWLETNAQKNLRTTRPFSLLIECFDPHEPWDPPLHRLDAFYKYNGQDLPHSPVYGRADRFTSDEIRQMRALYAAELTMVDHWFGVFLDKVDQLNLWEDTLIIVTTDHGFFLGEHGLIGKPDLVPLYAEMSHIPLMVYHPKGKKGTRSHELVQLVDLFPTIMEALQINLPKIGMEGKYIAGKGHRKAWERLSKGEYGFHGKSLLPILLDGEFHERRQAAFTGKFGDVLRVCDGKWVMYLSPKEGYPLYWYGRREPGRTFTGRHGSFDKENERFEMVYKLPDYQNELYHLEEDPYETTNVIRAFPEEVGRLEALFIEWLMKINAPKEMRQRYKVSKE